MSLSTQITSPESLVAIIVAARQANDRALEQRAKRMLKELFGVSLKFAGKPKPDPQEASA